MRKSVSEIGAEDLRLKGAAEALLMNARRFEIRENGGIEIEDQALETGPKEVKTPSRVNGASHGPQSCLAVSGWESPM